MEVARVPVQIPATFLLASASPELLTAIEPVLTAAGARVEVVLTAAAALAAISAPKPPDLALIDSGLPDMETRRLLAAMQAEGASRRFPIILIAESAAPEWTGLLEQGIIDDLILRGAGPAYWPLRTDAALRAYRLAGELANLCDSRLDRLTGVYNREAMLAMLVRETDRAQRMNGSLSLVLFDIDDFGHWNSRLGLDACDRLLREVAERSARLLRSYDLLGRPGKDEFLVALPGCQVASAERLAERLRLEVFSVPFRVGGERIRLSACFGIASSKGRSPVVVLREAERALARARQVGPESIETYGDTKPDPAPVKFLSPTSGDELLAW